MEPHPKAPEGYLASLRTLGDTLLQGAQERIELFTVELQEEKFRLIQTAVWIGAGVFAAILAITFASLTAVYLFWDTARLAVLGTLALLYTGAFIAIALRFRRWLTQQPHPFSATREEMAADRACIRNPN